MERETIETLVGKVGLSIPNAPKKYSDKARELVKNSLEANGWDQYDYMLYLGSIISVLKEALQKSLINQAELEAVEGIMFEDNGIMAKQMHVGEAVELTDDVLKQIYA